MERQASFAAAVAVWVPVAPDSEGADLKVAMSSHPTAVTNALFPLSEQRAEVFVGQVDDLPFRTEVTLLGLARVRRQR